jgi:hypothetical protein
MILFSLKGLFVNGFNYLHFRIVYKKGLELIKAQNNYLNKVFTGFYQNKSIRNIKEYNPDKLD